MFIRKAVPARFCLFRQVAVYRLADVWFNVQTRENYRFEWAMYALDHCRIITSLTTNGPTSSATFYKNHCQNTRRAFRDGQRAINTFHRHARLAHTRFEGSNIVNELLYRTPPNVS